MALTKGPLYDKLLAAYKTWDKEKGPEYREFRCCLCGEYILAAWHIWLWVSDGFVARIATFTEVHLCRTCGEKEGLTAWTSVRRSEMRSRRSP